MQTQIELVDYLISENKLKNERIINAFREIDRKDFIIGEFKEKAYNDEDLPVESDQIISKPSTIAFMLELLDTKPGETILEIGSGTGWTVAMLSKIVGPEGKVYGVEILPELVSLSKRNLEKYNLPNVEIIQAKHETVGLPEFPRFDKILVSAAIKQIPDELEDQFKKVLVAPMDDSIWKYEKEIKIDREKHPGFQFPPLK